MILHHENIDYAKHCAIPFGTYVQAAQENTPSNTQESRSLDCIYLRYLSNQQGGHELLHLGTGRVITRRNVTPIPLTQHVIDLVHAMAERDGMPDGLKIENKAGLVLYDSSWIAGVDYDDDEEYQDDPNGSEDESDDEENYDRMDPNEIADILDDQAQHNDNQQEQANPEEIDNEDSKDEASQNNDNNDDDDNEAAPDPEQDDEEQSDEAPVVTTRSGREARLPVRF
jgi:hypothetical protein